MTENPPRRVDQHEAEEKLGYEAGVKFMALQAHIRILFKTSAPIPREDHDRFWDTYYKHFHG
jgi:predicted GIY-YIG superfamily endonuclease